MLRMRACGYGQRPMARCRVRVSSTSSRKRPLPRRRRSSSLRFTLAPSQGSLSNATSGRSLAEIALDGFDDVLVPRAATEIAGKLLAQRGALEDDAVIGQRDGGEQEARRAVPALERMRVPEYLLHRVQLAAPCKTLDGRDGMAVHLGREHEARLHRLAVEQHRARAADALLAPDVGTVELELVAKEVDEQAAALDLTLVGAAVDFERYGHARTHCRRRARSLSARSTRIGTRCLRYSAEARTSVAGSVSSRQRAAAVSISSGVSRVPASPSEARLA